MSPRMQVVAGVRFGRLTVTGVAEPGPSGRSQFIAICDCGTEITAVGKRLKNGDTKSCGCLKDETSGTRLKAARLDRTRHGEARRGKHTPEYVSWAQMIRRCEDQEWHAFARYGERGIKVCERWRSSFENFLSDMGRKPSPKHTIDRYPDNDGNYEPDNCRWATRKEQANNRG